VIRGNDVTTTAWERRTLQSVLVVLALLLAGLGVRYATYLLADEGAEIGRYLETLCFWSCDAYSGIAERGYDAAPNAAARANSAYFPLYPATVWLFKAVTGLPTLIAGFLLSNGFVAAAALLSRPLFGGNNRAYWLFVLTLLVGPFSFFFSTLYSESLFILLTVAVLVALQRSNYLAAGIAGALLSATRPTGVLIVFAILTQIFLDHRRAGGSFAAFPRRVIRDPEAMLALFVAPLGLFAYMAYLHLHVGDALAFARVQVGWGRELDNPIDTLLRVFAGELSVNYRSLVDYSWAFAALVGLALSVALVVRGRIAAGVFCALCITVSLATGITSMVRFVAGLVPLGMAVTEFAAKWRVTLFITALLAIALGIVLTIGRLNGSMFAM
jgi:hypothetical protein